MRIFITEYLCSGAWPEKNFPPSLQREGKGMLEAVVHDLARAGDSQVRTTWDVRLGEAPFRNLPNVDFRLVHSSEQEQAEFRELARQSDVTLIIAPEMEEVLLKRCSWLAEEGLPTANATPAAVRLCGDKLALSRWCRELGIPAIPTVPRRSQVAWDVSVLKRRDGAGSIGMRLERSDGIRGETDRMLFQPFIRGRSLSVAGLFETGRLRFLLPVAEQILAPDGTFRYLGGWIPAERVPTERIAGIVETAAAHLPGLHGYIGFDFLIPEQTPEAPLLVEINPRLTSSYLGYRKLCRQNLGRWLIPGAVSSAPLLSGSIRFTLSGAG